MNWSTIGRPTNLDEMSSTVQDIVSRGRDILVSSVHLVKDEEGKIVICIDDRKAFRSINIGEEILAITDKNEIRDRLMRIINKAILEVTPKSTDEIFDQISHETIKKIFPNDPEELRENMRNLIRGVEKTIKEASKINNSVESASGNIKMTISGELLTQVLEINDYLLSINNKEKIEAELMETLNIAIKKTQQIIRAKLLQAENEFGKKLTQWKSS